MSAVSVIIPTYNRAKTIVPAIESVFAQGYRDWELIVVDDGSEDDTAKVVESYGDRIRFVRQENAGPAAARNRGVELARGEWLAFLDSDDTWRPEKLARHLEFTEALGVSVCFHDLRFVRIDTGAVIESWNSYLLQSRGREPVNGLIDPAELLMAGIDVLFTTTLLMRTEAFTQAGGFAVDMPPCEDIDLYLRLARSHKFGFLAEPLAERGWASNWDGVKTYQMRIEAMRRARERGRLEGDRRFAKNAGRAMAREMRCLAGWHRERQQTLAAMGMYFQWALASTGLKS
jgi:glycosyltransferase involved in cell wall biosynthesis